MKTATEDAADAADGAALPAVPSSEGADPPRSDVSWVARCQRQFGDDDDRHLPNLVDGENAAFYDGV